MEILRWPGILLLLSQWGIILSLQIIDGTFIPQIYFFVLICDTAIRSPGKFSIPFTIFCYVGFVCGVYFHHGRPPFAEISFVIPRAIEYGLYFGFCFVARKIHVQKEALDEAYGKLRSMHLQLEEKTLLEERMRVSREIHDIVGHTLTTALVGIETGKQLAMHNRMEQAVQRLEQTREQIKSSLHNVRETVHALYERKSFIRFKESLIALIDDTMNVAGVRIQYDLTDLPDMSSQQELAVYRALQEGLANGIRHGSSTVFHLSLSMKEGCVVFTLTDNGTMPKQWKLGFGLSSMEDRVCKLGGRFEVSRSAEGGCRLMIRLPLPAAQNVDQPA
ncbi:histidine kinase [Paenibacillus sp. TRM 82003]|nr:histidine kinase [Paenibacillus sp. TRM 82003]